MQSEKRAAGFLAVLPTLLPFCMYFYDIVFDVVLTKGYFVCSDLARTSEIPEKCEALQRSGTDYRVAFGSIIMLMSASLGSSVLMVFTSKGFRGLISDTREYMYGRHRQDMDYRVVQQYFPWK